MITVNKNEPIGTRQKYCSNCGAELSIRKPDGDNMLRYVCDGCSTVHYENPKVVVGCIVEHEGSVLLCKRAIEPRYDYWTVPAGFMELAETLAAGAARETFEEACAQLELGPLFAVVDVVRAGQVHVFFRGTLINGEHKAGPESLDTQLFKPDEIPWDEIAFVSGKIALKRWLEYLDNGDETVHYAQVTD